jgi:RNA polymerase sigma-70 factor (ECF subfamily)
LAALTAQQRAPAAVSGEASAAGLGTTPGFEPVFEEFAPYVLRVLPRLGVCARDVDDVAQEVFLAIHRGLPGFEGRSSLKTWVYGICIRAGRNHNRRAYKQREQLGAAADSVTDASQTPALDLESRRALIALDAALAQLPEAQRSVFVLHQIEALSVLEIAQVLDCSKFTIYARLYAARRAVLAALSEPGKEPRDHV